MMNLLFHSFRSNSFTFSSPSSPSSISPHSHNLSESFIEDSISNAENIITNWNPNASFHQNRSDAQEFLTAVNQLQRSMQFFFLSENSTSHNLIRAQRLMQTAMSLLGKEFLRVLSTNRAILVPESFSVRSSAQSSQSDSSYDDPDAGSEDEIQIARDSLSETDRAASDLHSIAECMISAGYGIECVKIYKATRQSIIDEGLRRLGFGRMSPHQVQRLDWEVVESKITNWLAASKIAVKTLFSGERILCDQVFSAAGAVKESCLAEISRDAAVDLFRFPESVAAKCKKSPEKMFRILDLYDALVDLSPEIESIFSYESTSTVRLQAVNALLKLREAVHNMLSDFESELQKDPPRSPVLGGGLHALTSYVMNYISFMGNYSEILADIFADRPFEVQNPLIESPLPADNPLSSIAVRIAWLILVLLCKLDGKAELYKDVGLSYLFLANNLEHIVSKVRKSELLSLLGHDWVSKHEAKVLLYAANYERAAWEKVVSELPQDPTVQIPLEKAKEAFKRFNFAFESAYRNQRDWDVPDGMMRDAIRVSVIKRVVTVYRAFYVKYQVLLRGESDFEAFVRFTPMDLEKCLSRLFSGSLEPLLSP